MDLGDGEFRIIAAHLGLFRLSRIDQAGALLAAFIDLPPMPTICSATSTSGAAAVVRRSAYSSQPSAPLGQC
jgi:endonuclease/exonuclease/phosphatase family metal-dependent hydrolase